MTAASCLCAPHPQPQTLSSGLSTLDPRPSLWRALQVSIPEQSGASKGLSQPGEQDPKVRPGERGQADEDEGSLEEADELEEDEESSDAQASDGEEPGEQPRAQVEEVSPEEPEASGQDTGEGEAPMPGFRA